jgi:hypothetical protein
MFYGRLRPSKWKQRGQFRCISRETGAHFNKWLPHDGDMKRIATLAAKEHAMTS